jgi:hypothetical protein
MSEIDWTAIRTDYESGLSLRQLAGKYNISKSAIGQRKYDEQWTQQAQPVEKWTAEQNSGHRTRDVNAAVRVQQALKHKLEGETWETVATLSGYASRGAAHDAVMRELDRCITHDVVELRTQQLYMLTQVQAKCYKAAMDPSNENWYWNADRVVNYSKRISELMGCDIPVDSTINQNFTIVREIPQGWLAPVEATTT